MKALLGLLLALRVAAFAECNCTTQNMTYTTQYLSVCATGCSSTTIANAITQAADADVCFCLKSAIANESPNVTRTTAIKWLFTADGGKDGLNTWTRTTANSPNMTVTNLDLNAILEFANIKIINAGTAVGANSRNIFLNLAASRAKIYGTDAIFWNSVPSATSPMITLGGFNLGAEIIFDRCSFRRTAGDGITISSQVLGYNGGIVAAGVTVTTKNSLVDGGSTTANALVAHLSTSTGLFQYLNNTFVGASTSCAVFNGTVTMTIKNNAFYIPNTDQSEYTAGALAGTINSSNNAYTKLTNFAGTGNAYGLTSTAFYDIGRANYRLSGKGSPLWNTGADLSSLGVVADIQGVLRPQAVIYDIGAYEQPYFIRAVPTAVVRVVPAGSKRTVPIASIRAVPTASIRGIP